MTDPAAPTWASKLPADMTDEELRLAKTSVVQALAPITDTYTTLSQTSQWLDVEINSRFYLAKPPAIGLPDYPAASVEAYFTANPPADPTS